MFLLFPVVSFLFLYVFLAILPAIYFMIRIYRQDRIEKEPRELLIRLIIMGVLAGALAGAIESVLIRVLNMTPLTPDGFLYVFIEAIFCVGFVEEGTKYFLTKKTTWNHPAFNYQFDGVVYCVFTSLGFAAIENVGYTFAYGPGVLLSRALLSIPGHMSFAVIMGTYYGRAKVAESYGRFDEAKSFRITGYVLASILHGLYDTCAMLNTNLSMICFILIVICVYLLVYRVTKIQAAGDKPVAGETVDMTFNPFEDVENVDAVEVSSETHKPHPLQDLMDKYD